MRYFILFFLLASCAHQNLPNPELYDRIVVVGTNDFHGYLRTNEAKVQDSTVISGGAAWFAGYVNILQKKFGDHLVMLDGGDIFQGTIESNYFLGFSTLAYYNLLPYRAAAVGNHEFDYGPKDKNDKDRLGAIKALMKEAKFPFVQANIFYKKGGAIWKETNLHPHVIIKAGDYKIGIVGLTTETTPAKTRPQNVEALAFKSIIASAKAEIEAVRKEGVDFVFITTHEGGPKGGEPIYELLNALPPGSVDAIVTGHSHTEVHEFVAGVPAIQSKTRGLFFGRIDLFVNKKTRKIETNLTKIHDMQPICGTWFKNAQNCDAKKVGDAVKDGKEKWENLLPLRPATYEGEVVHVDENVNKVLKPFYEKVSELKKEKLAEASANFEQLPSGETQVGDFFLSAFQWKFPEAKVVYLNGGGFRRLFTKGPITYGDLYEVHPFDNYAVAVKLTGARLKDLIRVGLSGSQSVPAISGVHVEYDTKMEPTKADRDVNKDGKMEPWERNKILSVVWEKTKKPVSDTEEFWVATNDYLAAGGDNTDHVFKGIPLSKFRTIELTQRDVAAEYLRHNRGVKLPGKSEMRIHSLNGAIRDMGH